MRKALGVALYLMFVCLLLFVCLFYAPRGRMQYHVHSKTQLSLLLFKVRINR